MPFHNCIAPFEFVAGCLRPIPRGMLDSVAYVCS